MGQLTSQKISAPIFLIPWNTRKNILVSNMSLTLDLMIIPGFLHIALVKALVQDGILVGA